MMSFHQLVWLILLNLTKNRTKNTIATQANKRPNRRDPKPENMHHVLTAAAASALAVANAQIDKSPQRIAPIKKTITMGNESSPTFCLLKRFNKFIFFFIEMCVTVVFVTVWVLAVHAKADCDNATKRTDKSNNLRFFIILGLILLKIDVFTEGG